MPKDGDSGSGSSSSPNETREICKACGKAGESRMVQCDNCDDWYDFDCVGVDQDVENHDWLCSACNESTRPDPPPVPAVTTVGAPIPPAPQGTTGAVPTPPVPPVITYCTLPLPVPPVSTVQFTVISDQGRNTIPLPFSTSSEAVTSPAVTTTVPPRTFYPVTGTNVPIAPMSNHSLMPPHPLMPINSIMPPHSLMPLHSQMPPYPLMQSYYLMPPYQSTQINSSMPPMLSYSLSNPYVSVPGVKSYDSCYTVPSSAGKPIPSVSNQVPQKSVSFVPTDASKRGSRKPTSEPLHPNHLPRDKQQVLRDNLSQHSGTSSRRSSQQKQLQLELQILDEERKLQEEEEANRREYLRKRHELMKEISSRDNSTIDSEEDRSEERICDWLDEAACTDFHDVPAHSTPEFPLESQAFGDRNTNPVAPARHSAHRLGVTSRTGQISTQQPGVPKLGAIPESRHLPSNRQQGTLGSGFVPSGRPIPRPVPTEDEEVNNLTRSQAAARQAVSRELPCFSGTPEEWPLFYSTFNTTTNMCGFTSEENLIRLQKCLKGKAFEAVKCRLMHPSNVPGIISTLKMLYGNPEAIVHNLIEKIRITPPPKSDRLDTLIEFSVAVQNLCATIEACQLDEYSYNVVLLRELVDKLPSSFKVDWAKHRRSLSCVNLTTFSAWLYDLAETVCPIAALQSIETKATRSKKDPAYLHAHTEDENESRRSKVKQIDRSAPANPPSKSCVVCKSSCPNVEKCARFAELSYNSRWATVKEFGLCRKCLKKHNSSCKSQQICGKNGCQFKHHQLLHNNQRDNTTATSAPRQDSATTAAAQSKERDCNTHLKTANKTLFRVVPVILYGPEKSVKTHAFLDDGSSLTLMDSALATELQLSGKPEPLCLRWTSNKSRMESDSLRLDVEISGTGESHKKYCLNEVHTISNLDLFHQSVNVKELADQYPYLRGLPIESYQNVQPRILIGIDHANLTLPLKGREGGLSQPIATKTRLGWMVHGGTDPGEEFVGYHNFQRCSCGGMDEAEPQNKVGEYFSLEGIGISKPKHSLASSEDQRAEDILKTINQDESGHYVGKLLWKYDNLSLPNSKPMALQRLRCLESRLKKDPELAGVMQAKIGEYLEKGYIRKLTKEELSENQKRVWYLPIFPVFNPNKPGKVRIVWDAAAKVNGVSLNSMLLTGPDQLTSLMSVLIKFRENKVAICGDLREMFHQVWMAAEDQHCLRFLWRENPTDKEPSTYVMQVMTFGACCSPSCAQYVKNLNAEKHAGQYPVAAKAIVKSHYVDDMLASTETEDEAIQLAQDVRHVHAQAGFEMRNWISNSPVVLAALQKEQVDEKSLNLGSELSTEKVLGMWWCTKSDTLTYKLSPKHDADLLSGKRRPTKREVLRTLMAIFDPLGLLSHLLIYLKVLLQEIWRSGVGWDDEIPETLNEKWEKWLKVLPSVQDVRIPRCYRLLTSISPETNVQLHTFVDASEDGYAAVVYLRFQQGTSVECSIIAAKSRVAPLKFVSIPRLELQAAVIGARLANTVASSLTFKVDEKFFWTDSRDVLCWIRSDHRRYSQFVAFRVSDILETSEITNWRWVGTRDNVADDATKWQRTPDLGRKSRWFNGPEFLRQQRNNWPTEPFTTGSTKEEMRHHLSPPAVS